MIIEYSNFSQKLFPGFYESILFNSDTLYELDYMERLNNRYHHDIEDFEGFQNDIAKECTYTIYDSLHRDEKIIKDIKYKRLICPMAYNFETDSLCMDVYLDLSKLKRYCFKTNQNDFNDYLHDNWKSYYGFISYIPNNIFDFMDEYKNNVSNKHKLINIMIEYYLLKNIDIDKYQDKLLDIATNNLYEYAKIYDENGNIVDYETAIMKVL